MRLVTQISLLAGPALVRVSVSKTQGVPRGLLLECTKKGYLGCAYKFRNGMEISTVFKGRLFAKKHLWAWGVMVAL